MVRLLDDVMSRGFETLRQLISHDGFTVELGEAIRKDGGVERAIRAMTQEFFPKEQTMIRPAVPPVPVPNKKWREVNGVIYFTVTSDGATGEQWIKRLEEKGFRVGDYAKSVLRSKDFKPTTGVTCEIAVLKGLLFDDNIRITKNIRKKASEMKLTTSNAEVACLIREMFSDKDLEAMGLWWIVTMHEPIVSDGNPDLLAASRDAGGRWFRACGSSPGIGWNREGGFAFVVPPACR